MMTETFRRKALHKLRNRSNTPPKGFRWQDPIVGGDAIYARNHSNWVSSANDLRVINSLEIPSVEEMEDQLCNSFDEKTRKELCQEYDETGDIHRAGPGTILKRILSGFGIQACWGCLDLAGKMDTWGPDGCEEHFDYIVEAMQQNAEHRKWTRFVPFREAGSKALVRMAIAKSRLSTETQ